MLVRAVAVCLVLAVVPAAAGEWDAPKPSKPVAKAAVAPPVKVDAARACEALGPGYVAVGDGATCVKVSGYLRTEATVKR